MHELEARLLADGLLRRAESGLRSTRRWQAAMARAALRLLGAGQDGDDLRVPIASALIEIYGDDLDDEAVADAIAVMFPIELSELSRGA
jgi:hypothetical protein